MSDLGFERTVNEWLEDGSDRTPPRAIDAVLLAVKTTPQERDLRIPWRFPRMTALNRATSAAAVALVAVLGAGGLYLVGTGGTTPPRPTATPTSVPTLAPTDVAPGIAAWKTYTSEVNGPTIGYPADWSLLRPAVRAWQAGDVFPADGMAYADIMVSPEGGDEQIALIVWDIELGPNEEGGVDLESIDGLKAWARTFCDDVIKTGCEGFADNAEPMCDNAGLGVDIQDDDTCRPAILVPGAERQFAFLRDPDAAWLNWDEVIVVVVAREDSFGPAAPYGGSVALLKSILTTMDVWAPGQPQRARGWVTRL